MDAWAFQFGNLSKISPFEGPQYHLAPKWAFYLQAAFMGFVFFVGTPLNAIVLFVTMKYKKLRQPLNYILVNVSLAGFIFDTFSVSQVFLSALRGYFFFGPTLCAMECAMGSIAGKSLKVWTVGITFRLVCWWFFVFTGLVTGWSLAVLAFERYVVICKPFGSFKFGQSQALGAVAFTWVMGIGCATPPFWGWSRWRKFSWWDVWKHALIILKIDFYIHFNLQIHSRGPRHLLRTWLVHKKRGVQYRELHLLPHGHLLHLANYHHRLLLLTAPGCPACCECPNSLLLTNSCRQKLIKICR